MADILVQNAIIDVTEKMADASIAIDYRSILGMSLNAYIEPRIGGSRADGR